MFNLFPLTAAAIATRLNDLDAMQYHVDNGADINIRDVHRGGRELYKV